MNNNEHDIAAAAQSALSTLKWSSEDYTLEVEGIDISDLEWSEKAQEQSRSDVADFMESITEELESNESSEEEAKIMRDMTPEQFGHDFTLTRNGHGAGFWDRGYGLFGDFLSKMSKGYGETYVFVDKDGALDFE